MNKNSKEYFLYLAGMITENQFLDLVDQRNDIISQLASEDCDLSSCDVDRLINESLWDDIKRVGKKTVLAGALTAGAVGHEPHDVSGPYIAKQKIDNFSGSETPNMTPEEWKAHAKLYPSQGNSVGFIPDPHRIGRWIPANGADSVRVQSVSQVDNDNLTRDDVGFTPYKSGKPTGPTNWSSLVK
jgi:hypothetical protein